MLRCTALSFDTSHYFTGEKQNKSLIRPIVLIPTILVVTAMAVVVILLIFLVHLWTFRMSPLHSSLHFGGRSTAASKRLLWAQPRLNKHRWRGPRSGLGSRLCHWIRGHPCRGKVHRHGCHWEPPWGHRRHRHGHGLRHSHSQGHRRHSRVGYHHTPMTVVKPLMPMMAVPMSDKSEEQEHVHLMDQQHRQKHKHRPHDKVAKAVVRGPRRGWWRRGAAAVGAGWVLSIVLPLHCDRNPINHYGLRHK